MSIFKFVAIKHDTSVGFKSEGFDQIVNVNITEYYYIMFIVIPCLLKTVVDCHI